MSLFDALASYPSALEVEDPMPGYELWTAVGTVAAVVVALLIALTQAIVAITLAIRRGRQARRRVATLISS